MKYLELNDNIVAQLSDMLVEFALEDKSYDELTASALELIVGEGTELTLNSSDEEFDDFAVLVGRYNNDAGLPDTEEEWERLKAEISKDEDDDFGF